MQIRGAVALFVLIAAALTGTTGRAVAAETGGTASMTRRTQLVNVPSTYPVSVTNTGTMSIKRVQITAPTGFTLQSCGTPTGFTVVKGTNACTYTDSNPYPTGAVKTFLFKLSTAARATDISGVIKVSISTVASGATFTNVPATTTGALTTKAHVWEITNVGVVAGTAPALGATPCPVGHTGTVNATVKLVVCGRNRGNAALTPLAANSSATGTLLQSAGTFSSTSLSKTVGDPVVLAVWNGAKLAATSGTKALTATLGSATTATSAPIALKPYTLSGGTNAPTAANDTASTSDGPAVVVPVRANDTGTDILVTAVGTPTNGGTATVTNGGNDVTFNPGAAFENLATGATRTSSFTYTITATGGLTASATVTVTVTGVDDATVNANVGNSAYTEGGAPVTLSSTFTVTDSDSPNLTSGIVSINDGLKPGDELLFTNTAQLTGTYYSAQGTLLIEGTAPPATYQAAMRTVQFRNITNDNPGGSRLLNLGAGDGNLTTAAAGYLVVSSVNDAPTITGLETSALAYTEQSATAVALTTTAVVGDADSPLLQSGSVKITSGLKAGDELVYTTTSGISGSYNAATGTLSLTTANGPASYQAALRAVKFRNLTNENPGGPRVVSFTLSDGSASTTVTRNLTVTNVDDKTTLTVDAGPINYTKGTPAVLVAPNGTLSDVDSPTITGLSVGFDEDVAAGDEILFTNTAKITATYYPEGYIVLQGTATLAEYQAALRTISYRNLTNNAPPASRELYFNVLNMAGSVPHRTLAIS